MIILFENAILVEQEIRVDYCKDMADNKFLEAAITGKADYIITGNTKHFDEGVKGVKRLMINRYKIEILKVS